MDRDFLLRAGIFLTILIALIAGVERCLAHLHRDGQQIIGIEVFTAMQKVSQPHPAVTAIYLGDSVARQLFPSGSEPSPDTLYVPCNAAISLAGQYFLLEQALDNCPKTKKVFLFLVPNNWRMNLSSPFTNDYFCEFFNSPVQVSELWLEKHDRGLLKNHVLRMLIPNILATNSWLNRSSDPTALLKPLQPLPKSASRDRSPVSTLSLHYLARMRQLCRSKGVQLFILPCPCIEPEEDAALVKLYDAPLRLYDKDLFQDGIHFKTALIREGRKQVQIDFERFGVQTPDRKPHSLNAKQHRNVDQPSPPLVR